MYIMKKLLILTPLLGLLLACSSASTKNEEIVEDFEEEIEFLEQNNQELEIILQTSETEIESLQVEIDDLLNEI
jgi:predicted RNase H-like nuclease (RuvC/YqgF family)